MQISKWKPLDEMDRLFNTQPFARLPRFGWDLAVDVFEQDSNVIAKMSLPAIDPDNIKITIDEDMLTIEGEREEEEEVDKKDYYTKEIRRGSFLRTVELPKVVDADKAEADHKDGVLIVTMPTAEGKEKKGIKVAVKK